MKHTNPNLDIKTREKIFAEKLHNKDNTKEYYSGFKSIDEKCYIKCLECGTIYKVHCQIIRQKSKYIKCKNCISIKKKHNEEIKKLKLVAIKENQARLIKAKKSLDYIQIELKVCKHCGTLFIGKSNYCSQRCRERNWERQKSRQRINNAKKNGAIDYGITLDKLIKRDNNVCHICNKECNINDYTYKNNTFIAGNNYPSIDHVVPLVKGGTHTWNNVKLAHRLCNSIKKDKIESNKNRKGAPGVVLKVKA